LSGATKIESAHPMSPTFVAEQVAPRGYFVASFANVTAFETDEGLVLIDTGSFVLAERTRGILRGVVTAPAHTAIWTHGHVDHCFGVELYEREAGRAMRVIAHEGVRRRFARYRLTRGWNEAINARQFRSAVTFPSELREPDDTFTEARTIEVGGRR